MKVNYTIKELSSMTMKELEALQSKLNKEATRRANILKKHGYSGNMTTPKLKPYKGRTKNILMGNILDGAIWYLSNPRSTLKGMRKFESDLVGTLRKNYRVKTINRGNLDSFLSFIDTISAVWGSLRYPSKYAVQVWNELEKAGISGAEIDSSFSEWLDSESDLLDMKAVLKYVNRKGKSISAEDLRTRMENRAKRKKVIEANKKKRGG